MIGPIDFKNAWVEMIMPSLSALLTKSSRDMFSNHGPSLRAMFFDQFSDKIIFFISPWFFLEEFIPFRATLMECLTVFDLLDFVLR